MKRHTVGFLGTPDFALPALSSLIQQSEFVVPYVITQPDRKGNKGTTISPPVALFAKKNAIPFFQPKKLTLDELQRIQTTTQQADCIVLAAYGNIIPKELLNKPQFGWVNIHPSLLPLHRGASPVAGAIRSGAHETGISIIRMSEDLDAGDILAQSKYPIDKNDTRGSLTEKLSKKGAALLIETLSQLFSGTLSPHPQDHSLATYTKRLEKKDGQIDWTLPAEEVLLHIRSLTPWPGAYTQYHGEAIKIHSAKALAYSDNLTPGKTFKQNGKLLIVCGAQTVLEPIELQRPGKKKQRNEEFIRGFQEIIDTQL